MKSNIPFGEGPWDVDIYSYEKSRVQPHSLHSGAGVAEPGLRVSKLTST